MPKIIEEVKARLLAEAKRQTLENGYSAMTIRSVVKACGVSVGTFYNYYSSKEALTAAFLLEDWVASLGRMREFCSSGADAMSVFSRIYSELLGFESKYERLFSDHSARMNASSEFYSRHILLRGQISDLIKNVCQSQSNCYSDFLPSFIAESLVTWSVESVPFCDIAGVLGQLFADRQ